jgi:hypothetical protein
MNMQISRRIPLLTLDYQAVYPPDYTSTYIKATNYYGLGFEPFLAVCPWLPYSGSRYENSWMTARKQYPNQRFHIDLGSTLILRRIAYNNSHHNGYNTDVGVKDFTLQGSNSASAFNNLNYATDNGWTNLSTDISSMLQHTETLDGEETKYINVNSAGAYRYYALKCANNWGSTQYMGIRKLLFYV